MAGRHDPARKDDRRPRAAARDGRRRRVDPADDLRGRAKRAGLLKELQLRERLDPDAARAWLAHELALEKRDVLDLRTRRLIAVGQHAVRRDLPALERAIRDAAAAKVPVREILEVIVQSDVYAGTSASGPALAAFAKIKRGGRMPRAASGTPATAEVDPRDRADPRYTRLRERHGPLVDLALGLRPGHHLDMLEFQDAFDADAAGAWLAYVYGGLYPRGVLDERTRLLCVVGDCLAADERTQARAHMAGALRAGATGREIAEVVIQSSRAFGQPLKVRYLAILADLMRELGRSAEIGEPPPHPEWTR